MQVFRDQKYYIRVSQLVFVMHFPFVLNIRGIAKCLLPSGKSCYKSRKGCYSLKMVYWWLQSADQLSAQFADSALHRAFPDAVAYPRKCKVVTELFKGGRPANPASVERLYTKHVYLFQAPLWLLYHPQIVPVTCSYGVPLSLPPPHTHFHAILQASSLNTS